MDLKASVLHILFSVMRQLFYSMSKSYTDEERTHLKNVGVIIRELRNHSSLSQEQLANNSGLDRTYIGSVERGERNISVLNLKKIADALNVKTSDLLKNLE